MPNKKVTTKKKPTPKDKTKKAKTDDIVWILGPCSMESSELYLNTAKELARIMKGKNWYYKASFDKANRHAIYGKRGLGLKECLALFKKVKKVVPGIKLLTDIHEPHQAKLLAPYIDCIQIPALLCRQTDLLVASGKYFDEVNVKKGQWMSPESVVHSVDKVKSLNPKAKVWLTERGTSFGYSKLIVDFSSVPLLHKYFDRVILDTTHSTQYTKNGFNLGDRGLAERFLLSADIFGYNGIFAETHPKPSEAITDGTSQIFLHRIEKLIESHDQISETVKKLPINLK